MEDLDRSGTARGTSASPQMRSAGAERLTWRCSESRRPHGHLPVSPHVQAEVPNPLPLDLYSPAAWGGYQALWPATCFARDSGLLGSSLHMPLPQLHRPATTSPPRPRRRARWTCWPRRRWTCWLCWWLCSNPGPWRASVPDGGRDGAHRLLASLSSERETRGKVKTSLCTPWHLTLMGAISAPCPLTSFVDCCTGYCVDCNAN
mmetsp:Transcript_116602/g.224721  ORF Transcript_116602/g.224721 Transcript_116602/m.224721 type:complete len:204 (-) Transcript_116602:491-1102(-)